MSDPFCYDREVQKMSTFENWYYLILSSSWRTDLQLRGKVAISQSQKYETLVVGVRFGPSLRGLVIADKRIARRKLQDLPISTPQKLPFHNRFERAGRIGGFTSDYRDSLHSNDQAFVRFWARILTFFFVFCAQLRQSSWGYVYILWPVSYVTSIKIEIWPSILRNKYHCVYNHVRYSIAYEKFES